MSKEQKLIQRFKRAVGTLNTIMRELEEIHPKANYYLANSTLNLMRSESHTKSSNPQAIYSNIITSVELVGAGGGDW